MITCPADITVIVDTLDCEYAGSIGLATATDNCGVESVAIFEPDCFKFTKKGKRIDKTESCVVSVAGDTITIDDSGGVGDHISWKISVTDVNGNSAEGSCEVIVVDPGNP